MNICIKKRKIIIQEPCGRCTFSYIINPLLLECQCGVVKDIICKHLRHYITTKWNFDMTYMTVLNMPQIRSWLKAQVPDTVCVDVNTYCRDFLHRTECCICLVPYVKVGERWILSTDLVHTSTMRATELYQCKRCREIFHTACYRRWNKDCPKCKYVRPCGPV